MTRPHRCPDLPARRLRRVANPTSIRVALLLLVPIAAVPPASVRAQVPVAGGEVERIADDIHAWRTENADERGRPAGLQDAPADAVTAWERELASTVGSTPADEWTRLMLLELIAQGRAMDACPARPGGEPVGPDCWSGIVRRMTSLQLTAEEVFQLGVDMRAELEPHISELSRETLGLETPVEARAFLTESPEWSFPSPEVMREESVGYLEAAEAAMHTVVRVVPTDPVEVVEMPEEQGLQFAAAAYYNGPRDGNPARFFLNTTQWEGRPRTTAATAAFHEGWPGHHYQQARHREFDRHPALAGLVSNGFVEGWGLYSELLADEMGLYPSPELRIGYLLHIQDAMMALQIDTGLHVLGWSREQAIDTMMIAGGRPREQAELYADRHMNTPGQTVTYILGYNVILELRDQARAALGDRFDIRDFHEALMSVGPAPLTVVQAAVEAWIEETR